MKTEGATAVGAAGELIADRYRVVGLLGRGGMAAAYEVHDEARDARLALKRLEVAEHHGERDHIAQLFQREFITLARLAHPRVVAVHDFGHDGDRPFYTMELLDGGDLREGAPRPWREVCGLLLDVASALSLVHSRKQVHRDVTPRNIRCTKAGQAKLIDFGAIAPFGVAKQVVGTPPMLPPEALATQAIDGRADLYALGATAYFALTGRHAYPVRRIDHLRDAWRSPPPPPSRFAADVPEALDQLVMALLNLQALARPASAAEVMERLSAIADLDLDEHLIVRQAYLNSPNLAGRERAQLRARKAILRCAKGRGGAQVIMGQPGVGRSRFVDVCVMEAKLTGARVARADASDASAGAFGVVRALVHQLLEHYGEPALDALGDRAVIIADVVPSVKRALLARGLQCEAPRFETAQDRRVATLGALRDWLLALSRTHPMVLAVDDIDRVDEPSTALLAALAHAGKHAALLVVASCARLSEGSLPPPVALLSEAGGTIVLRNLSAEDSEAVVRSVFGEVPNVKLVAERLFAATDGNPGALLAVAQHLVDGGVVRYDAGTWHLPAHLDPSQLPSSLAEALVADLDALSDRQRALLECIALASVDALPLGQCEALGLHGGRAALLADLEELVVAGFLMGSGEHFGVAQPQTRALVAERVPEQRARDLHDRLSHLFEGDGGDAFRVASHAWKAGQAERAIGAMLAYAREVEAQRRDPVASFERVRGLPADRREVSEAIIDAATAGGQPLSVVYPLHVANMSNGVMQGESPVRSLEFVLAQLYRDAGLDLYDGLADAGLQGPARLQRALMLAQQRYDATDERDRACSPREALPRLSSAIVSAIGVAVRGYDRGLLARAPSLGPAANLAPALQLVELNRTASLLKLGGNDDLAHAQYKEILQRMEEADRDGVDLRRLEYMRLAIQHAVCGIEVAQGIASGVAYADLFAGNPSFAVNAARQQMTNALRQGHWQQAEARRVELELMRIQNCPPQIFEGTQNLAHLLAFIAAEDLVSVKQTIPALTAMARELPGWQPILGLATAAYDMLRGDAERGLAEIERQMGHVAAGHHVVWPGLAHAHVSCLLRLNRADEALAVGGELVAAARAQGMESVVVALAPCLAIAHGMRGETAQAVALADGAIAHLGAIGATGVALGQAHEARARVALLAEDQEGFARHAELCAEQYRVGHNPVLTAKYERLVALTRAGEPAGTEPAAATAESSSAAPHDARSHVATLFGTCLGSRDRARATLDALVERTGSRGGFLFLMGQDGPVLSAHVGAGRSLPELDVWVREYLDAMSDEGAEMTVTLSPEMEQTASSTWADGDGRALVPALLSHVQGSQELVTGLAVLVAPGPGRGLLEGSLVTALSLALHDAGDVVTAHLAC